MIASELIEILKEMIDREGDNEVVIESKELDYFLVVSDVSGKWSTFDRSRYDGSPIRFFIHGEVD